MAKIMVVEDDNNLSEIYQARMTAEGYTVIAANDGEEALALAAKEKPDLIIADVMMPKISGFEMLDILRNTQGLSATKVIVLTALGQAEDRTRANSLGADLYLVKSQVTLEDIVKNAKELLAVDTPTETKQVVESLAEPSIQTQVAPSTSPTNTPETTTTPLVTPLPQSITSTMTTPHEPVSYASTPPITAKADSVPTPAVARSSAVDTTPAIPTAQSASEEARAVRDQVLHFEQPAPPVSQPVVPAAQVTTELTQTPNTTTSVRPLSTAVPIINKRVIQPLGNQNDRPTLSSSFTAGDTMTSHTNIIDQVKAQPQQSINDMSTPLTNQPGNVFRPSQTNSTNQNNTGIDPSNIAL